MYVHVLVYGSLRKNGIYHEIMEGYELIQEKKIQGFEMFSAGKYPFVVPNEKGFIKIEKYKVPQNELEKLDKFEGIGIGLYSREWLEAENAYIYIGQNVKRFMREKIISGDWIKHKSQEQ